MDLHPSTGASVMRSLRAIRAGEVDRDDPWQFIAFADPLAARSHGQLFQDLWALWEAAGEHGGYFVEFGAADGIRFSNTYLLEREFGWTGILADRTRTSRRHCGPIAAAT